MEKIIIKITDIIIKILYPENLNCIICKMPISRKNRYSLCKSCREKIVFIQDSCVKCGKPILNLSLDEEDYSKSCGYCKGKKFLFDRNISFLEYSDISKNLVFGLKYSGKTYLSKIIAEIIYDGMKKYNPDELEKADYIMYVPLSKEREKERGFNQAEKIACYLSEITGIKINSSIHRIKDTKKLHKIKSDGRKKELLGAFSINEWEKEELEGKNIILIDDIFTTGSTINEISKVLRLCNVDRIVSLTLLTGKYNADVTSDE